MSEEAKRKGSEGSDGIKETVKKGQEWWEGRRIVARGTYCALNPRRVERGDDATRGADDVSPHRGAEEEHGCLRVEFEVVARVDLA